jgi:quercetin dioxygenase-like cupin family protein
VRKVISKTAAACELRHLAGRESARSARRKAQATLRISDTLKTRQDEERVIMKVVTLQDIPNVPVEGAEPIEGWTGPVSRSRQTIIQPGDSANYNCSVVNFSQGCTTGWHTHTCDQILVVTSGSGMVATEHEKREINVGDVVHIKAGERHWHGAKADATMGHITITAVGSQAAHG